ncbi:maleylpyruvate isomerase family mycothiol-dependent enzyme [Rhodococcus artemisiae]|uniref:Maleylpyruvate isomerase family mycothiol-dependent enzyme n=1 Tax=Rhodococcus artemisiae TaxID=714159 RepID=A0ABU7LIK4_9NOCA|nr:maleylpyruvate isomerase family mycothiol-dependent enzyme [Rhodococcus artemisiae]MEE2061396.1 maleylpyruvate isomerase family mycothiol-dependent enzyme [Rhodococcus artemisiae]
MSRSVMALAHDERADLADFLETLSPRQWEQPSLCQGWTVRDVVAHMISYEEHDTPDLLKRVAKTRFRPWKLNEVALAEYAHLGPDPLVDFLRRHLDPQGATARFGGRVGLVDALIHHQDIRRPLGVPRPVPPERLRCALPFAVTAPPLRGFWKARGVRLVATDLDWTYGRGPEARGPGEAVLMTMAGRRGIAKELSGPGAEILGERLG